MNAAPQIPNPQSPIRNTSLPSLTHDDRENLDIFTHLDADLIAYAKHRCIEPTEALEWSLEPHIHPWITALTKARHDHRHADLMKSLSAALDSLRTILKSDAADRLKTTAVNSMTKLAHAILRGGQPLRGGSSPFSSAPNLNAAHLHQNAHLDLTAVTDHHTRIHRNDTPPQDHFPELHTRFKRTPHNRPTAPYIALDPPTHTAPTTAPAPATPDG